MEVGTAIFCAVDKIEIRRMIWDAVKDKASFFTDGRMSAEVLRVLTACDSASRKHYPTTLFAAGEAYAGPGCTTRASAPHAGITKIVGVKLKPFVHARIYAGRAHGMKGRPMSKSQAKTRKKTRPTRPAGAQLGARKPAFAAATTGGKLLPRIRRLLGAEMPGPLSLGRCLSGVLALAAIIAIAIAVGVSCSLAEPSAELANTPATQAAEKAEKERISALIEQLGSSKFEERRAAQQALVGIGPAALPALRAASQGDDSERSIRANQALESIQRYERIPDTVSQVLLKTYVLGKRAPIASPPGLGAEEFLKDIATDGRIAELLQIAAKGSSAERSRLKKAAIAAMRKYVDELPETIGPDEPWRPNARNAPGVFVCAYLLSSFDEQPAEMLDLLAQVMLRYQTALAANLKGRLKDFAGSQDGLLLAMACCHYLDLCQRDLGRKGALNAGQTKAIKEYAALKDSLAGKGTAAEIEQVAVFRAAVAFALAGGNEKVRKLHDGWLAATAPARQKGEKLKAILPSGTEIELVAVSDYPDKNHPWWRPDGVQFDTPPIDPSILDITSNENPNFRKIELVFRLGGKADQPAYESHIRQSDGGGVWWAGRRSRGGKFASDFKVVATDVPADSKTVWLDLLVAAGPWETVATCDGRQAKGPLSAATPGGRASGGPSTVITARFDPNSKEARVIGIDANGVEHTVRGFDIRWDAIRSGDGNAGANFLFQGLKPEQFKSFTLQTRPNNELIHLTDISLVPGQLTDAQLIPAPPATLPATGPAPSASSGQATQPTAGPAEIKRLIRQLGSEKFAERDVAQQALVKIGSPAVLPLARAMRDRDPEVASRAKSILVAGGLRTALELCKARTHPDAEVRACVQAALTAIAQAHTPFELYLWAADSLKAGGSRRAVAEQLRMAAERDPNEASLKRHGLSELAENLLKMADEDDAFKEPKDPAALEGARRIEYLTFKLRDVAAEDDFVPGKCQIFLFKRDNATWAPAGLAIT